jgi:hypothetical protein
MAALRDGGFGANNAQGILERENFSLDGVLLLAHRAVSLGIRTLRYRRQRLEDADFRRSRP